MFSLIRLTNLFVLVVCFCEFTAQLHGQLFEELLSVGIEFGPRHKVALPAASLIPDQSDEAQLAALEKLAGKDGWQRFSKNSIVAPVSIDLAYVKDEFGERVGHQVHSAFVIHAKLATLGDKELLSQIFGRSGASEDAGTKLQELTQSQLERVGLTNLPEGVRYLQADITLLEKIRIRGVIHTEKLVDPQGVTVSWRLDPRFANDAELKATWHKLEKAGIEGLEKPLPYFGWGGYLRISQVRSTPNILLIESHMLMHEPTQWFSGSNFIRSKLPLAIQEGARSFRRSLRSADSVK
jgi:hypothetical protein